jgi:BirA family biotin operon repressor/biotin-[acetyl-CoA-carboxylase] ligase
MAFSLGPQAIQAGYRVAGFDSIGSTNTEALQRGRAGDHGPLWIVARAQTEGRGRRGRSWSTDDGNLAASLLASVNVPPAVAATLGFVAGLALRQALENCTNGLSMTLKWPNDVLADGRKIAGILLESEPVADLAHVVVGMGVNVVSAPGDMPFPAVALAQLGQATSAEHVFAELSDAWGAFYDVWNEGRGFEAIRTQWTAHAAGLGKEIAITTGDTTLRGIFKSLDGQGRLILQTLDGEDIPVSAGDVYFGDAATVRSRPGHS